MPKLDRVRRWLWVNSLAVVCFGAFLVFLVAQSVTGWLTYNDERTELGLVQLGYLAYLGTGHFAEATMENWESEFLQMGSYVLLAAVLVQRGSPEANPPDRPRDDNPANPAQVRSDSPAPVRRGGWWLQIYQHSLSIMLLGMFLLSFLLHLLGGTAEENVERHARGEPALSAGEFLRTSHFWFQSMQNWQSEFLAVGVLIVATIFLRQRGSAQSKKVTAPHSRHEE
ncbi:MAG: DUF6766 family protein [Actinomycetes bacterium]